MVPWSQPSQPPKGTLIGLAVSAGCICVINTLTDKHADRTTCNICNDRSHLCSVWCGLKI